MVRLSSGLDGSGSGLLSRSSAFTFQPQLSAAQIQLDGITATFADAASDWRSLLAMSAGGLAYRATKLGVMSVGAIHELPLLARLSAPVLGLTSEVTVFRAVNSLLTPHLFRLTSSWSTDFVNFASLKIFGHISRGHPPVMAHALQDLGMVAGHHLAHGFNLATAPEGSLTQQLLHAEITNLQMQAGMALLASLTGNRLALLETRLHLESLALANRSPEQILFSRRSILSMASSEGRLTRDLLSGIQDEFPLVAFLSGRRLSEREYSPESHAACDELLKRLEDPLALRRYIEANLNPEDPLLTQFTDTLKPIGQLYEVQAIVGVLRFLGHREKSSERMRSGFFDVISEEPNPRALARRGVWKAQDSLLEEIVEWMRQIPMRHVDPWTRHYTLRLLYEWALLHPEILSPEHQVLRNQLAGLALGGQMDPSWPNMMMAWYLFRQISPEEAMSETFYEHFPFARVQHPSNLEFGLRVYVDATRSQVAFIKHQRTLSGVPVRIGTVTQEGSFSHSEIHPSHSLADFNPNPHRRFEALKQKYGFLVEMGSGGRLNRESILRAYLMHRDPEEGPVVYHWRGRYPWLKGGHHRMSALYLAGENGLVPREWLQDLPLQSFDWSPYLPSAVYRQFFSRGAEALEWQDVFPSDYQILSSRE